MEDRLNYQINPLVKYRQNKTKLYIACSCSWDKSNGKPGLSIMYPCIPYTSGGAVGVTGLTLLADL